MGSVFQPESFVIASEEGDCCIRSDCSDFLLHPAMNIPERTGQTLGYQGLAQDGAGREVDRAVEVNVSEFLLAHVEVDAIDL